MFAQEPGCLIINMLLFYDNYFFILMCLCCDSTRRMVESRRHAVRETYFHPTNTTPINNFEYCNLVTKASKAYTPKVFKIFQKQFKRVQQYNLEYVEDQSLEGVGRMKAENVRNGKLTSILGTQTL